MVRTLQTSARHVAYSDPGADDIDDDDYGNDDEDNNNNTSNNPSHIVSPLLADPDKPSQALSSYDLTNLELGVNRIRSKWAPEKKCFIIEPDNQEENEGGDGPPTYPPTHIFTVFRTFAPTPNPDLFSISKKIHVWSPHLVKSAKVVIEDYMSISWNAKPVIVSTLSSIFCNLDSSIGA